MFYVLQNIQVSTRFLFLLICEARGNLPLNEERDMLSTCIAKQLSAKFHQPSLKSFRKSNTSRESKRHLGSFGVLGCHAMSPND